MARKLNGLLVKDGKIERVEIGDHQHMQELIGGYFTTAFRLPGGNPEEPHLTIDGWCDDEFLLKNQPFQFFVDHTIYRGGYAYGGNVLIMGGNMNTGDSRSLTEVELSSFSMSTPSVIAFIGRRMILPQLIHHAPVPANN